MCRKVDANTDHVVSGKLPQLVVNLHRRSTERHDKLGKIVHWKLATKCNFEAGDKWYEHEPKVF